MKNSLKVKGEGTPDRPLQVGENVARGEIEIEMQVPTPTQTKLQCAAKQWVLGLCGVTLGLVRKGGKGRISLKEVAETGQR